MCRLLFKEVFLPDSRPEQKEDVAISYKYAAICKKRTSTYVPLADREVRGYTLEIV